MSETLKNKTAKRVEYILKQLNLGRTLVAPNTGPIYAELRRLVAAGEIQPVYLKQELSETKALRPWHDHKGEEFGAQLDDLRKRLLKQPAALEKVFSWKGRLIFAEASWYYDHACSIAFWVNHSDPEKLAETPADFETVFHRTSGRGEKRRAWAGEKASRQNPQAAAKAAQKPVSEPPKAKPAKPSPKPAEAPKGPAGGLTGRMRSRAAKG